MKSRLFILFFLSTTMFYCLVQLPCYAIQKTDTSIQKQKKPSDFSIDKKINSSDYQYGQDFVPATTWWDQFKQWFNSLLSRGMQETNYDNFWKYVFWLFAIATIIFVILKLLGADITMIFSKNNKTITVEHYVMNENIHDINLSELVAQALVQNDYRLAVRYNYLLVLKKLSDKKLIEWKITKNNRSYADDLQQSPLQIGFLKITALFEYVWYGEFNPDEKDYQIVNSEFIIFNAKTERTPAR